MSDRRRGLGRGLGALIPSGPRSVDDRPVDMFFGRDAPAGPAREPNGWHESVSRETPLAVDGAATPSPSAGSEAAEFAEVAGARFAELPWDAIRPNPRQPRQVFDDDAMAELVASIRAVGLLQPVVVRAVGDDAFELVMGERRWRACREAGLATVPAIVRTTPDDDMLRDALLENLHRSQLNPLEEAAAYQQLLEDFGCTHDELAVRIGRSRPQVTNTLRLLRLPPHVQRRVAAGVLSAGHARALLAMPDGAAQERLSQRIVAEGLSVRAVEEIVAVGEVRAGGPGAADPDAGAAGTFPLGSRRARPVAPRLADLAAALSERFDTRVKVDLGRRKGRITMEFATVEDLHRIVGLLDPSAVQHLGEQSA